MYYNSMIYISFFRKLKLYEEQELTMQVFSEPDHMSTSDVPVSFNILT